jgi:hypothetical protein
MSTGSYCKKFKNVAATKVADVDLALLDVWNLVDTLQKQLESKGNGYQ